MSITQNRKAYHDFYIEEKLEAGLILEGWEVKSIREGKAQLKDSYIKLKNGQALLLGCHISPLKSASTHLNPDPSRIKKLLLNKKEINKLIVKVDQKGYSLIALDLHYKNGKIKVEIALAKGKKLFDKREVEKEKEARMQQAKIIKNFKRS